MVFYKAEKMELVTETVAKIILHEGKNREIRNVFQVFKQPIARLIRVRIGNLKLGKMEQGEMKEIPEILIRQFIQKTGKERAGDAGKH